MAESLRIGIAGLGTVGASVARVLAEKADELTRQCGRPIAVTAVSARSRGRDRGVDLSAAAWFDDPVELARSADIDVFVELMGGDNGPAHDAVKAALEAGRHVVTANKALLARHGVMLAEIAEKKGVLLNYEAAVAGGIPVIKTMREAMAGNSVRETTSRKCSGLLMPGIVSGAFAGVRVCARKASSRLDRIAARKDSSSGPSSRTTAPASSVLITTAQITKRPVGYHSMPPVPLLATGRASSAR